MAIPRNLGFDNYQMILDYDGRTDQQPVFQGYAPPGTLETEPQWTVYKYIFVGNDVTQRLIIQKSRWSTRATDTFFDPQP